MSIERELLRRISSHSESRIPLHFIKEIQQLLAQPEQEQQPEAWILKEKETGYKTQVVAYNPSVLKKGWEAIPLYAGSPKREPLINIYVLNAFKADDEATHPYSYWAGVEFAEKHHGIGGEE